MNPRLQEAIDRLSQLSDFDQRAFAEWIFEELEENERWNRTLDNSIDLIEEMAQRASEHRRAGRTQPLDPNTM